MVVRHEVRRDRHVGRVPPDDLLLGEVEVEEGVGPEAVEVEQVRRVPEARRRPRREQLVPVRVPLAPERRAPGLVEPVERHVPPLQPSPELGRAGVAVAGQVVARVLVRDVPQGQRRVVGVAGGQLVGEREREVAVEAARRAPRLAATGPQRAAVAVDREDLGVGRGEPGRWARRRGGEVDGDVVGVQEVHHVVEPGEVVLALRGLQPRPREDPEGHEGHPGLAHQPHVVGPHLAGPLLGVVVPSEADPVSGPGAHPSVWQVGGVSTRSVHAPPGSAGSRLSSTRCGRCSPRLVRGTSKLAHRTGQVLDGSSHLGPVEVAVDGARGRAGCGGCCVGERCGGCGTAEISGDLVAHGREGTGATWPQNERRAKPRGRRWVWPRTFGRWALSRPDTMPRRCAPSHPNRLCDMPSRCKPCSTSPRRPPAPRGHSLVRMVTGSAGADANARSRRPETGKGLGRRIQRCQRRSILRGWQRWTKRLDRGRQTLKPYEDRHIGSCWWIAVGA